MQMRQLSKWDQMRHKTIIGPILVSTISKIHTAKSSIPETNNVKQTKNLTAWLMYKINKKETNIVYRNKRQTLHYRLVTWNRHIQKAAGFNFLRARQHSPNLGAWTMCTSATSFIPNQPLSPSSSFLSTVTRRVLIFLHISLLATGLQMKCSAESEHVILSFSLQVQTRYCRKSKDICS